MTGETFTAAQFLDAAHVILERIPVACECFPCAQERQHAAMLVYAARVLWERDYALETAFHLVQKAES